MKYIDVNREQRNYMKSTCTTDMSFSWNDSGIMDTLLGKLPSIRTHNNEEVRELIRALEETYNAYDAFCTDPEDFISRVETQVAKIYQVSPYWNGLNLSAVKRSMKQHQFCLISGEGGIGKSYFVKCLEEHIEDAGIPHLCIYGKFKKNLGGIDFEEIRAEEKFVLIVDAVNEMPQEMQLELYEHLKELKDIRGCRIIVTYRTNRLTNDVLEKYTALAEDEYVFPGVSFESALDCLTRNAASDVYLYEDILYSNNPLLLSILSKVLSKYKMTNQKLNSITSVTYIFEQYIKNAVDKPSWEKTKSIAAWMYQNNCRSISYVQIADMFQDAKEYVDRMQQMNFMVSYVEDNLEYYEFGLELLSDFLIARKLLSDLSNGDDTEHIKTIKDKVEDMPYLEEAIILVLFDKYAPDYCKIKKLLVETGLLPHLSRGTLRKVIFRERNIAAFQKYFIPSYALDNFEYYAGYVNQPFNCVNYINQVLLEQPSMQITLSRILEGPGYGSQIKNRLKNIMYAISATDVTHQRKREAFWFSLWCSGAPNKDIRNLAIKTLYEIVHDSDEYQIKLISVFSKAMDHYIKESIVLVLSKCPKAYFDRVCAFFQKIKNDPSLVSARVLSHVADYLSDPYDFIHWNKQDLYDDSYDSSEEFDNLIGYVDLVDKGFLPFRYFSRQHIDMHRCFLKVPKTEIEDWNEELKAEFKCLTEKSYCCGSLSFETKVLEKYNKNFWNQKMSSDDIYRSYAKVAVQVLDEYGVELRDHRYPYYEGNHSLIKKCLDISADMLWGSLMCNYYSDEFGTYNSKQNSLGYEVYDPYLYLEDFPVASPLTNYKNVSEALCDRVVTNMYLPEVKDTVWVRDAELTRKNLRNMSIPIRNGKNEWVMIAGRISIQENSKSGNSLWIDKYIYWCCTADDVHIVGDGNERYLTIELDDYTGALQDYDLCEDKPYLCKHVPSLSYDADDTFDQTGIVLPPADMIKRLGLKPNVKDMTWLDSKGEVVLYCNNCKYSYYSSPIGNTVFIRKDVYDRYMEENGIIFFAYAERYHHATGYVDETSLHFEIERGEISREFCNNGGVKVDVEREITNCDSCPYGFNDKELDNSEFSEFLQSLHYNYGDECT